MAVTVVITEVTTAVIGEAGAWVHIGASLLLLRTRAMRLDISAHVIRSSLGGATSLALLVTPVKSARFWKDRREAVFQHSRSKHPCWSVQ